MPGRILYHFTPSLFSRRVRLALALKGVGVELREARENPAFADEARALWPLGTFPVLVESTGEVLGDSTAIARYLDAQFPERPALFPTTPAVSITTAREVLALTTLVDGAAGPLADLGSRFHPVSKDPAFGAIAASKAARAQGALTALGAYVAARGLEPLTDAGWCAADIWLYTAIAWLAGLPARAEGNPGLTLITSLPWSIPAPLSRWAEAHRERADVQALDRSSVTNADVL